MASRRSDTLSSACLARYRSNPHSEERGLSVKALQFMSIRDAVMERWELEVRERIEGARAIPRPILTDALPAFFDNIGEALSPRHPRQHGASGTNAPSAHGDERARMTSFSPDQVIHEYQIFRECIVLVAKGKIELGEPEWAIIDRSINEATREAVRAFTKIHEDLRCKVAASLSHDMRTPLAVIGYGAHLISITADFGVARRAAMKIEASSSRLRDMMADLLDALTYQGGAKVPLRLDQFDMLDLVADIREQYCHAGDEGVVLVGQWCRDSMRRAVENLVNNAIKYGDGGAIKIMARQTRGRLMLTVRNEGKPIPEDRHDRIFEYFRREDHGPAVAGWGVGLPFVKAVAESHGGSVSVDSSAETGTTFLVDIPVDARPFAEQAPGHASMAR